MTTPHIKLTSQPGTPTVYSTMCMKVQAQRRAAPSACIWATHLQRKRQQLRQSVASEGA